MSSDSDQDHERIAPVGQEFDSDWWLPDERYEVEQEYAEDGAEYHQDDGLLFNAEGQEGVWGREVPYNELFPELYPSGDQASYYDTEGESIHFDEDDGGVSDLEDEDPIFRELNAETLLLDDSAPAVLDEFLHHAVEADYGDPFDLIIRYLFIFRSIEENGASNQFREKLQRQETASKGNA
jgi:hypothetical protein